MANASPAALNARVRLALTVAVVCAAAIALIAALAPAGGSSAGPTPVRTGLFYGATLPSSTAAVDFALRDQNGQLVHLSDYAGSVTAVTFLYSTCANTCTTIVSQLSAAIDELAHPIPALAISVDPKQDSTTNVKSFLLHQQALASLHLLVARRSVLEPIWKLFAVTPQRHLKSAKADFSVEVVLIDKTGHPRVAYRGLSALDNPDVIAADIRTLEAQPMPAHPPTRRDI
ncbi:MAG TPA: SCO family protein [Solirubrobacteraceae bacterium]